MIFNNTFKNDLYYHFSYVDNTVNEAFYNFLYVSKKHKTLFFHNFKTGGTSIVEELKYNGYDDNILSNKYINRSEKLQYLKDIINNWDQYFKVIFVRNKFSLLKSLYNMNKYVDKFIPQNVTFENFINLYYKSHYQTRWLDQYNLTHINNKCIFDFIGEFSNYKNDREAFFNKIKIKDRKLHSNKGKYKKENLSYTNDMIKVVKDLFKEEFDYFKWKIE